MFSILNLLEPLALFLRAGLDYGQEVHRSVKKSWPRHDYLKQPVKCWTRRKNDKIICEEVLTGCSLNTIRRSLSANFIKQSPSVNFTSKKLKAVKKFQCCLNSSCNNLYSWERYLFCFALFFTNSYFFQVVLVNLKICMH